MDFPYNLGSMFAVMWTVYCFFAFLGMSLFNGVIVYQENWNSTENPGAYEQGGYWMLNFDDFAASLVTLWTLMIVNNWFIIIDAYRKRLGQAVFVFMICWWFILVVVVLAPITAIILDTYAFRSSAREKSDEEEDQIFFLISNDVLQVEGNMAELGLEHEENKSACSRLCPTFLLRAWRQTVQVFVEYDENGEFAALKKAKYIFKRDNVRPYTHNDIYTPDMLEPSEEILTKAVFMHPDLKNSTKNLETHDNLGFTGSSAAKMESV
ncbi:Two pore calcium channel protein 2 [Cichlidogyrus casuarinus]|uniref:Two pore calcium channel protein 2 n=1 Tax=Cichlidogyrus casuarinus TaxID=1844966 RepID=A0ABD2QIN8_9PLAT